MSTRTPVPDVEPPMDFAELVDWLGRMPSDIVSGETVEACVEVHAWLQAAVIGRTMRRSVSLSRWVRDVR